MSILKRQVWSKQTPRKVLETAVIVFAAFWFGSDAWFFLENNWLTPMERAAASEALVSIDELQQSNNLNEDQFSQAKKKATWRIEYAERKVWTIRDQSVVFDLRTYLLKAVANRKLATNDSPNWVALRERLQKLEPISGKGEIGASLHQMLDH